MGGGREDFSKKVRTALWNKKKSRKDHKKKNKTGSDLLKQGTGSVGNLQEQEKKGKSE